MPDTRSHRGPHPEDAKLFAPQAWPRLRSAVADLSWLLSRGYALPGAIQVVGNRYDLEARQRQAVTRSACSDEALRRRRAAEIALDSLAGATLLVDGYNVLTTVEAALGGGVVLLGRDGTCRDIAGIHGTYRRVDETLPALRRVATHLRQLGVSHCAWYLDAPVSNSGRLKAVIEDVAGEVGVPWAVHVVPNPDAVLIAARGAVIASADSVILDGCERWASLAREVVTRLEVPPHLVDLRD